MKYHKIGEKEILDQAFRNLTASRKRLKDNISLGIYQFTTMRHSVYKSNCKNCHPWPNLKDLLSIES